MNVLEIKKINCESWGVNFTNKINVDIANENLSIVSEFLNKQQVDVYCVFFGTLLGFIRDGNFMTHDEDTDIALINPTNDFLLGLKKKLIQENFYIFRDDTFILSGMRKGEYIDFHKFFKFNNKFQSDCFIFNEEIFEKLTDIQTDSKYTIKIPFNPKNVLEVLYGKSWTIKLEDHHVDPLSKSKNNRLNYDINLMLYKFYSKAKKSSSLLGIFARSSLVRLIINIYNKIFDFLFRRS